MLIERAGQKIDLQSLLPDLRMQCLHVQAGFALLAGGGENRRRTLEPTSPRNQ